MEDFDKEGKIFEADLTAERREHHRQFARPDAASSILW